MSEPALRADAGPGEALAAYGDMVYKLAFARTKNSADAEDVFQEVFLRYITAGVSFESEEHRKAWLIRVTVNCSNKLFASAFRRRGVPLEEAAPLSVDAPSCEDESGVLAAVQRLPLPYRTVVHLFYYEDLSIRQICEALHKKEGTVKSQLNRARAMLQKELKGAFDDV